MGSDLSEEEKSGLAQVWLRACAYSPEHGLVPELEFILAQREIIEALEGEVAQLKELLGFKVNLTAEMVELHKEKKAAEAEAARLRKFRDIVEEFSEHDDPSVKYAMREALEGK